MYLYGIGQRTKEYIDAHSEIKIEGIFDGFQTDGFFYGIPILDIESIDTSDSEIIILARKASEKIIYERIKNICIEKGIRIKNIDGEVISYDNDEEILSNSFFEKTADEIIKEVREYKTVSFDIFDTILKRKCGTIENLWREVEVQCQLPFDFVSERIKAEKQLTVYGVPTLCEIYKKIAENTKFDMQQLFKVKEIEIETDRKNLYKNEQVYKAYKNLLEENIEIYFITDMYYNRDVIESFLYENEINGYKDIFISCENGTGKNKGLFKIYKKTVNADRIIHIGDSEYEDAECAKKYNIDSCIIRFKKREITSYELGGNLLAPALYNFTNWIMEKTREDGIEDILFISRDGYLIKKIYDILTENINEKKYPKSRYFLISRSLAVLASIENEDDIRKAAIMSFDGTPEEMLIKRFQLSKDDIPHYSEGEDREKYILKAKNKILEKSKQLRTNYLKYINTQQIKGKRLAIFDFLSTGTCQLCLEKLMGEKLKGYYFERSKAYDSDKQNLDITSYVCGGNDRIDNYFYIEPFIKAVTPSLIGFDEMLCPEYAQQKKDEKQIAFIKRVQQGVLDKIKDNKVEINDSLERIKLISEKYLIIKDGIKIINYDTFSNRKV